MVFNRIDQDSRSFVAEGHLPPIYKPPLNSDIFFPSPSHFTTSSSRFASYPSSKSSDLFHFDSSSTTSNRSLSAPCVGQPVFDKLHSTTMNNMSDNYNFNYPYTVQDAWNFIQLQFEMYQQSLSQGGSPVPHPILLDSALQQNFIMGAIDYVAVASQAQQNIQAAPVVAQDPIAQGFQNNIASDIVYPTFDPVLMDADQFANLDSANLAKIEQVSDHGHDIEIAPEYENDVDAEGEPVGSQDLIDFSNAAPMTPEAEAALAHLRALPTAQLSQAVFDLQNSLQFRQTNTMTGEEMNIDQTEQVDGIPTFADTPLSGTNDIQNVQVQAPSTQATDRSGMDIRSFPPPDLSSRESKDQYLLDRRADGFTYREIKEAGGFAEAEPTLRGRWRTLTKEPEHRLRKPVWKQNDLALLRSVTYDWFKANGKEIGEARPPWKILALEMFEKGASYHFGSGTISKMWAAVLVQDQKSARREIALARANA